MTTRFEPLRHALLATTLLGLSATGCVVEAGLDDEADTTDETDACDEPATWYIDADGDGFGDDASAIEACEPPEDGVDVGGDCDDGDPEVNPAARDIYDGIDNDCNDLVDDLPHWGYSDEDGHIPPDEWAQWWPACDGDDQSPIDVVVDDLVDGGVVSLEFGYAQTGLLVENNGHTLHWTVDPGSTASLEGETYVLEQFHIHAASERTLMGDHWAMEIHMVHRADQGTMDKADDHLFVLGLPVSEGPMDNPSFETLGWSELPAEEHETLDQPQTMYDPFMLFPIAWLGDPSVVTYSGSLTTPPCTEGVQWVKLGYAVELGADQIAAFTAIYSDNFRPTQPLGDREVTAAQASL